eukprot:6172635-Pleurochrysis_carterae.AAC.2
MQRVCKDRFDWRNPGTRRLRPGSVGSSGNRRGKRVPVIIGEGLSARIRVSIAAARSAVVPPSGDPPRRSRSSLSNCASRKA